MTKLFILVPVSLITDFLLQFCSFVAVHCHILGDCAVYLVDMNMLGTFCLFPVVVLS